jgi:nanoRNase/pAp phosphatase (c-di-AMP/oligoRNAs hydrolase)
MSTHNVIPNQDSAVVTTPKTVKPAVKAAKTVKFNLAARKTVKTAAKKTKAAKTAKTAKKTAAKKTAAKKTAAKTVKPLTRFAIAKRISAECSCTPAQYIQFLNSLQNIAAEEVAAHGFFVIPNMPVTLRTAVA